MFFVINLDSNRAHFSTNMEMGTFHYKKEPLVIHKKVTFDVFHKTGLRWVVWHMTLSPVPSEAATTVLNLHFLLVLR